MAHELGGPKESKEDFTPREGESIDDYLTRVYGKRLTADEILDAMHDQRVFGGILLTLGIDKIRESLWQMEQLSRSRRQEEHPG